MSHQQLANFVRTHEKALANALQFRRQNAPRHGSSQSVSSVSSPTLVTSPTVPDRPSTSASTSNTLAAALSLGSTLSLTSHSVKSAKLALTPHHLFYLLSRFEELGIPVGPMKVRLEDLHDSSAAANYVSFLSQSQRSKNRGSDVGSIRSTSSVRSVMSGMSALWASFGIGSSISAARTERQKAALQADLKYLYSAFTKIPCLKLAPDFRARLIRGYEEFPFDSAVPLHVFKNVQALEVSDMDFRQFFGWDKMADQLRSLTVKRASIDDPADILIDIVLDDMDKRRRRTSKAQSSPTVPWGGASSPRRSPILPHAELYQAASVPGSPEARNLAGDLAVGSLVGEVGVGAESRDNARDLRRPSLVKTETEEAQSPTKSRPRSHSPRRPTSSRNGSSIVARNGSYKIRRSGSGSSHSSLSDSWHNGRGSSSNLLAMGILPSSKWRFLKHLSLADNSLTSIPATSLAPLSNTLHSLDLSSNLFTQIPDSLATLTALRALNLAHCMIDSLHSLTRNPLPAITALNLRANRLTSLAGIEKLYPLERLDLRDNRLTDPMELARLTGIPEIREVWVEGNPLARTHRDFRITIFNLFRKTPGYTEDITIDATGPTYSEKRFLVDRALEPPAVPVVRPPVLEMPVVDITSKPTIIYDAPRQPATFRKERFVTVGAVSEGNTRRRRAPKRRIVDLATNDNPIPHPQPIERHPAVIRNELPVSPTSPEDGHYRISQPLEVSAPSVVSPPTPNESHIVPQQQPPAQVPRIDTRVVVPQLPPPYSSQETQTPPASSVWGTGVAAATDDDADLYRHKIETIRDQVGSGYLGVLSEEGSRWTDASAFRETDFAGSAVTRSAPSLHHHASTPALRTVPALHNGRSLV